MPRRKPYTRVEKIGQARPEHVVGKGDVVFKGFQCLNPVCQEYIFVERAAITPSFTIPCPRCRRVHTNDADTAFFNYQLRNVRDGAVIREGEFRILHADYISSAQDYKYCLLCYTLRPLDAFDLHKSRRSGRQGECRLCKAAYNALKNPTRIPDQHREAAQKRRLYIALSGPEHIDSAAIYKRFDSKCFKCAVELSETPPAGGALARGTLDHTLPVKYLWPLTTDNATLLCSEHNSQKSDKWPSNYYTKVELRRLVRLTGLSHDKLAGAPHYNPTALDRLSDPSIIDPLLDQHAGHMEEIITLRNSVLRATGVDLFAASETISADWVRHADSRLVLP